jgi:hypothetical protein
MNIDSTRLAEVQARPLDSGGHSSIESGMCIMEAVSYVAGEEWSDTPECACPVIGAFLRNWNDSLPNDERTDLLRDLIPLLVGTRSTPEVEQRRATMAADWLIRTHAPAWLRLAKLDAQADALARLPEITDFAQCPGLMRTLEVVRKDSAAAGAAAWDAARAAAWDAAWDAAGAAAWDAARAAAGAAAWDAARAAAGDAAGDAAWAAAWAAAWDAAGDAAGDALADTKRELQQSAKALVIRMCEAQP